MGGMPKISKRAAATPASKIRAVFNKSLGHDDWAKFTVGEPDFDTVQPIIEGAYKAALEGNTHYVHNAGIMPLRERLAKKFFEDNKLKVDPETEVMITNGGTEAIYLALQAVIEPGDEVIIPGPQWTAYPMLVTLSHGKSVVCKVFEEDNFMYTEENLRKSITSNTRMIILNSPCNPTGTMADRATLEMISEVAKEFDLWVLSDEVYEKLLYDGNEHISIATLPGMKERTVVINSFSKTYAMTGWRVGYATAPASLMQIMVKLHELETSCCNVPAQFAAIAALDGDQGVIDDMLQQYERRREMIISGLNVIPGISCRSPQGTFYAFANVKSLGLPVDELVDRLMDEVGLVVVPGTAFGDDGEGFLRFSFAVSDKTILDGLNRLETFVKKL